MLKLCLGSPWCRRDSNNIKMAVLAGLLHDIGKALSVYQKAKATRLSFGNPPHEEVSAYIASCILSTILSRVQQANPQVQHTVVKAIEMHHQGLRLLTLWESRKALNLVRRIKREDMGNISRCIKESVDLFEKMLCYLGSPNYCKNLVDLLNKLKDVAELNLEQRTQPLSSIDIVVAKLFTGMLIAADYIATRLNLLRVSSKCVEETLVANEIYSYVLSLNLGEIQNIICGVLGGCTADCNSSP